MSSHQAFEGLDFPVRRSYHGEPVPDLARLDRGRWRAVLAQISPGARRAAMATATGDDVEKAMMLVGWLDVYGPTGRWKAPIPPAAPDAQPPVSEGPPAPRRHQLNVRLREQEHRTLRHAAEVAGLLPAQLARMLVVQGSTRLLIQEDRLRRGLGEGER